MTTTTLILARHGHVEGIHPERFRGRMEVPLSEKGEQQAAALAATIAANFKPTAIYTSTLGRCIATGAQISQACAVPAEPRPELGDIDYGDWQWKTHEDVKAADAARYALWRSAPHLVRFPSGESLQDVAVRAADLLRFVLDRHAGESVVLVGHDSVNRVLLSYLLDLPATMYWGIAQEPCNLSLLEWSGTSAKLVRLNDVSHLQGL
ncbi:histidine phosphatase family protein [Aquabacter sp. CN5-332]|uniref:histidine phosphatase family protein n=1 Tax=Aquabacter sp. CN5-332 TaxID=3156608 RepID=UPI0032B58D04